MNKRRELFKDGKNKMRELFSLTFSEIVENKKMGGMSLFLEKVKKKKKKKKEMGRFSHSFIDGKNQKKRDNSFFSFISEIGYNQGN